MSRFSTVRAWFSNPWTLAFTLAAGLLTRNLIGLSSSPPGAYIDEASVGYNAWTIAHFGVDEHGHAWPLFFQAFGEYKNPLYIYILVPFVRVFGLTPAVIRTPAALLGFVACLAITATAWQLTKSKGIALLTLLICAFLPWLSQESRLGFEVISMVTATSIAMYCVARAVDGDSRWLFWAGVAFGFAIYGYTSGRLESAALVIIVALGFALARYRGWWRVLIAPGIGYAILIAWNFANPGALTSRFSAISIFGQGAPLADVVHSFINNYIAQIGIPFLFLSGDGNPRHNTGFSGEFLVVTAPLLIWGIVCALRSWRKPFYSLCVLGFFGAPVAAAVTANGIPHSLRAATMIPFGAALIVIGIDDLQRRLTRDFRILGAVLIVGLVGVEGIGYTIDQFSSYEVRSAFSFDAGVPQAIQYAIGHRQSGTIYLSANMQQPYIEAFMVDPPTPPPVITSDTDELWGLSQLHMRVVYPVLAFGAANGDELVQGPGEVTPPNCVVTYRYRNNDGFVLAQVCRFSLPSA